MLAGTPSESSGENQKACTSVTFSRRQAKLKRVRNAQRVSGKVWRRNEENTGGEPDPCK